MPRPVYIGALVTVNHWQRRVAEEEASRLDDTVANFCVRSFAKLDTGDVVFGPPPGIGVGVPRDELAEMDFNAFSAFVAACMAMQPPEDLAAAHGYVYTEHWEQLAHALKQSGVDFRADNLIEMPLETIVDAEVRNLLRDV